MRLHRLVALASCVSQACNSSEVGMADFSQKNVLTLGQLA